VGIRWTLRNDGILGTDLEKPHSSLKSRRKYKKMSELLVLLEFLLWDACGKVQE